MVVGLLSGLMAAIAGWDYKNPIFAAESFVVHFEEMSIPISIKELIDWSRDEGKDNSELASWLEVLGFEDRDGLKKFLDTPLIRDKSMARQILNSWAGQKLLDEVSDLVRLDDDSSGLIVFSTLESLLNKQNEVTILDLLANLPVNVINFDLDGWVQVANKWRIELKRQQELIKELGKLSPSLRANVDLNDRKVISNDLKETKYELLPLDVKHRLDPLKVEIWNPSTRASNRKSWIIFMPGLGGDQSHFRWLARSLVHKGWPVIVLEHPGSDSNAIKALLEGSKPLPGAEVIPERIADLQAVLNAREKGIIQVKGENLVLMGHSLGALTAFLASGATPSSDLEVNCKKALDGLSLSNLSALLQCQLIDIQLPMIEEIRQVKAIVGINSFGSLLWSNSFKAEINVPVFLAGGTYDLITPAISEQLGLSLSIKSHPLSRILLIEGSSHFSPIRVEDQLNQLAGDDLFQLGESLVGVHTFSVQSLLAQQIISFLDKFELGKAIDISTNQLKGDIKFHILDRSTVKKIIIDQ